MTMTNPDTPRPSRHDSRNGRRVMELTEAQNRMLAQMVENGFVEHRVAFGRSQANRPMWTLVDLGLAHFGFGPPNSFLQTQGFMPTDAGRAALEAAIKEEGR